MRRNIGKLLNVSHGQLHITLNWKMLYLTYCHEFVRKNLNLCQLWCRLRNETFCKKQVAYGPDYTVSLLYLFKRCTAECISLTIEPLLWWQSASFLSVRLLSLIKRDKKCLEKLVLSPHSLYMRFFVSITTYLGSSSNCHRTATAWKWSVPSLFFKTGLRTNYTLIELHRLFRAFQRLQLSISWQWRI
jgi:hypothetical protein